MANSSVHICANWIHTFCKSSIVGEFSCIASSERSNQLHPCWLFAIFLANDRFSRLPLLYEQVYYGHVVVKYPQNGIWFFKQHARGLSLLSRKPRSLNQSDFHLLAILPLCVSFYILKCNLDSGLFGLFKFNCIIWIKNILVSSKFILGNHNLSRQRLLYSKYPCQLRWRKNFLRVLILSHSNVRKWIVDNNEISIKSRGSCSLVLLYKKMRPPWTHKKT